MKVRARPRSRFVPLHQQRGRPGRPRKAHPRRSIHVRVDHWIADRVEEISNEHEMQTTVIVETALEQFLAARGVRRPRRGRVQ